jgi:putative transposase
METDPVDQRMKFIADVLRREESFAATCRRYEVSRQAGYKLVARYLEAGPKALYDRPRAPHAHPNATPPAIVDVLIDARRRHRTWGPKKLLLELAVRYPGLELPAPSTAGEILRRQGLTTPRRRSRAGKAPPSHLGDQAEANRTWAIDFKGQFRTRDGQYCYPLTLEDGWSRFCLRVHALLRPTGENVRFVLESAFQEFGLPVAMRSDNGPPFAATSFTGLTALSVWWIQLGIRLDRTEPGSPQQNGRLERLHRTLQQDVCDAPEDHVHAQQIAFTGWRTMYNDERPHEALDMKRPADIYTPSARPYPDRIEPPAYGDTTTRRVQGNGQVAFDGWNVNLSTALTGHEVAFRETGDGVWELRFCDHILGNLDVRTGTITNGNVQRTCDHSRVRPGGRVRPRAVLASSPPPKPTC